MKTMEIIQITLLVIISVLILIILASSIKTLYKRNNKLSNEVIISVTNSRKFDIKDDIKIAKNNGLDLSKFVIAKNDQRYR